MNSIAVFPCGRRYLDVRFRHPVLAVADMTVVTVLYDLWQLADPGLSDIF